MAHGHTSDEEINVANWFTCVASESLEAAQLLGCGLVDAQHLWSGGRENDMHSGDIRLHASGVLGTKGELAYGRDRDR
jgi:hypothetical protein